MTDVKRAVLEITSSASSAVVSDTNNLSIYVTVEK